MIDVIHLEGTTAGVHPVVILDIDHEDDEIALRTILSAVSGTSQEKQFEQIEVKASKENGLSRTTYFNINPFLTINSLDIDDSEEPIGLLEEIYFNEIMEKLNKD